MWFSIFVGLQALFLTSVHGTFIPQMVSEFINSSSSQKAESFQESSSNTVESFTKDAAGGQQEFESSTSESAAKTFQESSASFNKVENSMNGLFGQTSEYESSQSSSSKTEAESFQASTQSTLDNFTNGAGSSLNQQELSVRASNAAESIVQESESSFNAVENAKGGGIFDLKGYESSFSKAAESLQKSSRNTMESFTNAAGSSSSTFGGGQKYESSSTSSASSQAAETLEESSSNIVEGSINGAAGIQEYESSQTSSKSSSSKSASNYEHSSSSCTTAAFDYDAYVNAFEQCKFISDVERQCYLKWLETFPSNSLNYYSDILQYLSVEKALSEEILDYDLVQKEIFSVHKMLTANGIYDISTDLSTKTAVYEKCKSKLGKALKGLSQNSSLYKLLKYSASTDLVTMPCTIGLLQSILKNQETYFSQISSTSSAKSTNGVRSKGSSTTFTTSSGGNSVDVTHYQKVLQAANIAEAEYQLYSNYLSELAANNERSFDDMINFFNKNTQVITSEMILDFASLSQEVRSVYGLLVQEEFFAPNTDWLAKKAKLTELKSKLSSALGYLSKDCCMYSALQYCLEKDISYLPLFVGLSNYLLEQQSSYFSTSSSASSSTTVTSSKSSCSC